MDDFAYVGIKDGMIRAFCRDDGIEYPDEVATTLADWIKMGRTVERMPAKHALERMKAEHVARKSEDAALA